MSDSHTGLHSEQGALPGEHPDRALRELRDIIGALRADNELDLTRLRGLLKAATT